MKTETEKLIDRTRDTLIEGRFLKAKFDNACMACLVISTLHTDSEVKIIALVACLMFIVPSFFIGRDLEKLEKMISRLQKSE